MSNAMIKTKPTHYEVIIIVEGRSTFPIDMLRYDRCCPAEEADSAILSDYDFALRRVRLRRFMKPGMNPRAGEARWNSFLWRIVGVTSLDAMPPVWDPKDA